jgi:hypothetical protein
MPRLLDVSLEVLARDANFMHNAQSAIALWHQWPQVMGPEHPFETELRGDDWFVYAYTVVKYAIDHFPNPLSPASLQQSRRFMLMWAGQAPHGPQPHMMIAALAEQRSAEPQPVDTFAPKAAPDGGEADIGHKRRHGRRKQG